MINFISSIIEFFVELISSLGYPGIFLGMVIESSFFPFPSEVILPPAGVLIARGEMTIFLVLLFATLGSIVGALINYSLAYYFGRKAFNKLIKKYGNFFFINSKHLSKSESYFKKHGQFTTFSGRLIPGIRQIISLPAGFAKMNLLRFIIFTALGSLIWSTILVFLGMFYGGNQEAFENILGTITLLLIAIIIIFIIVYIRIKSKKRISSI
jgi:membrane protein DedA with SNARE-associated domain